MPRKMLITIAFLSAFGPVTPVSGHAHLDQAKPAAGSTLDTAPPDVVLTFTQPLERAFSSIQVRDAAGKRVDAEKTEVKRNAMRILLKPLSPGIYKVNWRVLSVDTHRSEGSFTFTVKP